MDNEFEFPPDQLDSELVQHQLDHNFLGVNALMKVPVEQLPPTNPPGPEKCSIRQRIHNTMFSIPKKGVERMSDAERRDYQVNLSIDGFGRDHGDTAAAAATTSHASLTGDSADTDVGGENSARHDSSSNMRNAVASYTSYRKRNAFTEAEVQQLYGYLSQFGTDFSGIAIMYKNRTRDQVKQLFKREKARNPKGVLEALSRRDSVNIEEFNRLLREKKQEEDQNRKVLAPEEEEMLRGIAVNPAPAPYKDESAVEPHASREEIPSRKTLKRGRPEVAPEEPKRQPSPNKAPRKHVKDSAGTPAPQAAAPPVEGTVNDFDFVEDVPLFEIENKMQLEGNKSLTDFADESLESSSSNSVEDTPLFEMEPQLNEEEHKSLLELAEQYGATR